MDLDKKEVAGRNHLLVQLGGGILDGGLAPHLLALLAVLQGGEVNPFVRRPRPVQVG